MTKEQTLLALDHQLNSFFSLQQVIDIVQGIDPVPAKTLLDENVVNEILDEIERCLDGNADELVDKDSIEFSLGYNNQIEIENAAIDVQLIMGDINAVLDRYIANKV